MLGSFESAEHDYLYGWIDSYYDTDDKEQVIEFRNNFFDDLFEELNTKLGMEAVIYEDDEIIDYVVRQKGSTGEVGRLCMVLGTIDLNEANWSETFEDWKGVPEEWKQDFIRDVLKAEVVDEIYASAKVRMK